MAVESAPFGLAISKNGYGFALGIALEVWDPRTPKPIAPGSFDARTTAVRQLYYVFSRDPLWRELADFFGQTWQTPSDQQAEIAAARLLANAIGQTLDEIGYGFDLPRQGLGDEDYRAAIPVRGATLTTDGAVHEIVAVIAGLYGEDAAAGAYVPWYPAAAALFVPPLSASQAALLASLIAPAVPSGVGLTLVVTDPAAPGWSYSDPATVDTWAGPRWDYSGGSDISAASRFGYGVTVA